MICIKILYVYRGIVLKIIWFMLFFKFLYFYVKEVIFLFFVIDDMVNWVFWYGYYDVLMFCEYFYV